VLWNQLCRNVQRDLQSIRPFFHFLFLLISTQAMEAMAGTDRTSKPLHVVVARRGCEGEAPK
jgi:hypothetical protein